MNLAPRANPVLSVLRAFMVRSHLAGIDSLTDASHSFNLDHRLRPEMLRTAMATAFF
jgi:hypothetical protein